MIKGSVDQNLTISRTQQILRIIFHYLGKIKLKHKNKPLNNQIKQVQTMKKLVKIIAVAAFAIGFGVTAQAQVRSDDMTVSATVYDAISVEKTADLNFGQVMKGAKKYIKPGGGAASSDGENVSTAGIRQGGFKVFAGAGSNVILSFNNLTELVNGTNKMPIIFNENEAGDEETTIGYGTESSSLTRLNVATSNPITFPTSTVDGKNGTYVYVGATVDAAADQVSGIYTATLTLTATYN
ncbi:DUF4402 domain-containing protein [Algoriphagus formosus]|nr:DUF4402 domain-containing protein [Algoriphagus aquimaris]